MLAGEHASLAISPESKRGDPKVAPECRRVCPLNEGMCGSGLARARPMKHSLLGCRRRQDTLLGGRWLASQERFLREVTLA